MSLPYIRAYEFLIGKRFIRNLILDSLKSKKLLELQGNS